MCLSFREFWSNAVGCGYFVTCTNSIKITTRVVNWKYWYYNTLIIVVMSLAQNSAELSPQTRLNGSIILIYCLLYVAGRVNGLNKRNLPFDLVVVTLLNYKLTNTLRSNPVLNCFDHQLSICQFIFCFWHLIDGISLYCPAVFPFEAMYFFTC